MPDKHHPYSPSSLQNLEACPSYQSRDTQHVRAIAGTLAHKVTETEKDEMSLGDDDALAAAECLDFVNSRRKLMEVEAQQAMQLAGETPLPSAFQVLELKETYLPIDAVKFPDTDCTTGGYADRILINYNRTYAEGFDYKFGFWAVEGADTNLQGICYSLGIFRMFPTVQKVRFFFKQPHLDLVTDAIFTREMVPQLYLRVQAVVARARLAREAGDFATATPYVPVCNFCANLGKCPKGLGFALNVAKKFLPLEFPDDITPSKVLAPDQTSIALRLSAVMKIWADAFRRQVTDRVLRRDAELPPGYSIQTMKGRRQILDLKKFRDVALRYVSSEEYETCLDASFTPLEKIISDKAPRGQKEATVKEFQQALVDSQAIGHGDEFSFLRVKSSKQ